MAIMVAILDFNHVNYNGDNVMLIRLYIMRRNDKRFPPSKKSKCLSVIFDFR